MNDPPVTYYISNILQRDYTTPGNISVARKIAGLSDREADDIKVEHAEELYRYGLQRLEEGYKVIDLSSKRMRLKSEIVCIDFRKY